MRRGQAEPLWLPPGKDPHQTTPAVLEIAPPQLDALDATRRIAAEAPQVRVVIVSRPCEEGLMVGALRAGAVGYLSKAIGLASLAAALRGSCAGRRPSPGSLGFGCAGLALVGGSRWAAVLSSHCA